MYQYLRSSKCFEKIGIANQEKLLSSFWGLADYRKQNIVLASFMKFKDPSFIKGGVSKPRLAVWNFHFCLSDQENKPAYKRFLCKVLKLGDDIFRNVQKKNVFAQIFQRN